MPRLQSQSSRLQNEVSQLVENVLYRKLDPDEDFVNNFPGGYPTLAERYAKRSKEIHVHYSFCGRQYCAVFYRPLIDRAFSEECLINVECCKVYDAAIKLKYRCFSMFPSVFSNPRKCCVSRVSPALYG
jgi:hypothetical protein